MKKMIALLLAALMIVSMAACSTKPNETTAAPDADQSAAPADNADAAPEQSSGGLITIDEDPVEQTTPDAAEADEEAMPEDENHTTCSSVEEINQRTGGRIARPTNVELPFEQFEVVIDGENTIGQYVFEAGGVPCGIRFCDDFNACISEMQNEDGTMLFDGSHEDEVVAENGCIAAHWETVDGQYILVAASEDEDFFNSLYEEFKAASIPGDA